MSEKEKQQNCDLDAHLHEEGKVESPEKSKPVDSPDVTGVKPLRDSVSCDHGNNNGESGFRDSENNRYLDSVLEYTNRIRAFVGFEGDHSVELPPPPLPKPLVIDNADDTLDQTLIGKDIDAESDSVGNPDTSLSSTLDIVPNRDLNTDEPGYTDESNAIVNPDTSLSSTTPDIVPYRDLNTEEPGYTDESKAIGNSDTALCASTDDLDDLNINTNDFDGIDNNNDELDPLGDPDTGLCADTLHNQNININEPDCVGGESNSKNPDENLPVLTGSVNCEYGLLENTNSGFVDEMPSVELLKISIADVKESEGSGDPVSSELKNTNSEQSIPSAMINNGYTGDTKNGEKEKDLDEHIHAENASNELQLHQSINNDSELANETIEKDNIQETTNNLELADAKVNLKIDLQNNGIKVLDFQEGMEGIDNNGFEGDILARSGDETNANNQADVVEQDFSASNPICDDSATTSGNKTENQLLSDTISGKTAEVFLFDPEYVEELQKELLPTENEVKPVPDMALLRRLSTDVVNKVLDDAGNQIREILDERKRSTMELSELVSNAEHLMSHTFSEGNTTERAQNNLDISDMRTGNDATENGKVSAYEKNTKQFPKNNKNEMQLKDVLAKTYDFHDFQKKIESEMNKFDPRYDVDPDTICGIGSFKPKWIQPYATAKMYLVLYSIVGMLSGCYYTYLIGTLSTLEKRFAFKSKVSGTIMMVDEITPLFLGVLIGYFGGKTHRPRMVGIGMLLSAICCFVSALPYFIYGPATHLNILNVRNETNLGICDAEVQQENCESDDRPPTLAAILFLMLGSFLKGFGNLAYYAIGLAYMDDNAKKKHTPMYFTIAMSLRLVGPFLGFLLSSKCLKYYENPFDDPGFGPEDPRWIGGWWMGFLLQGILLLIFCIPISLFPRKLPGYENPVEKSENTNQIPNFSGLLVCLKRLGKNPLYVFIVLNTIVSIFGGFGHYIMLPKYMENQFHLSSSDASLLSGPPGLVAVMIATIIGGYSIWKLKPTPKILTALMVTVEIISALGFLILMIPRCERIQMANFGFTDEGLILNNVCNFNCNCTTAAFTPVCGSDGKTTYFSPCYAGCSERTNKTFTNCSCVSDSIDEQFVTDGYCAIEGCWSQTLAFIITLPTLQLIASLLRVAHTLLLLRSIRPEDKSIALGTFETILCAFAFIPFPIVYGAIVDSTCLVWESSCGKTGNCWFYDVDKFNYMLHGSSFGFSILSILCLIVIFFLSGRVHNLYDDDDETKDTNRAIELDHQANFDTKM